MAELPDHVLPPYHLEGPADMGGLWSIWGTGWAIPVLAWGTEENMRFLLSVLASVPVLAGVDQREPPALHAPGQDAVTDAGTALAVIFGAGAATASEGDPSGD